eukprot:CAMPEP_0202462110 /NCGR_PEP_ID=MMETSP1360-20130828/52570_1 /ASSEMBLY_ACC=CAM_ASM_000848 /TAXON_ID=515479 /ORGANISM="Licmophora paradoxa, Strain CCMP2313" /LENGTH=44 /DNA_ID= /DNA_START= /DNA_END= /DNA_ORIENTATION=
MRSVKMLERMRKDRLLESMVVYQPTDGDDDDDDVISASASASAS